MQILLGIRGGGKRPRVNVDINYSEQLPVVRALWDLMGNIDTWGNDQWQALLLRFTVEELTELMESSKRVNSLGRSVKLLEYITEFKVVKSMEDIVGIILSQCRSKMADSFDIQWGDNVKFREALTMAKGIKMGMTISPSSTSVNTTAPAAVAL